MKIGLERMFCKNMTDYIYIYIHEPSLFVKLDNKLLHLNLNSSDIIFSWMRNSRVVRIKLKFYVIFVVFLILERPVSGFVDLRMSENI